MFVDPQSPTATAPHPAIQSIYDMVWHGGPVMWPLFFCSIVALAYVVERTLRLREAELGSRSYGRAIVEALSLKGPAGALALCAEKPRPLDFVRVIAVARLLMPAAHVRLSAGRTDMSDETQALCFLAGANSIFYGEKLLTTENPTEHHDRGLFEQLGLQTEKRIAENG